MDLSQSTLKRVHDIAVQYDTPADQILTRINDLLDVACEIGAPLEQRLEACFWLQAYDVYPSGVVVGAPSAEEYANYVAQVSAVADDLARKG